MKHAKVLVDCLAVALQGAYTELEALKKEVLQEGLDPLALKELETRALKGMRTLEAHEALHLQALEKMENLGVVPHQ